MQGLSEVPSEVLKGHGTENDFVLVADLDGHLDLSAADVRALCDRRAGIGADGVLRVVRTAAAPEVAQLKDQAEYFMDYRNADGSVAEMCGNGIRVFLRYLQRLRLVEQDAAVATRGGIMRVRSEGADGDVSVQMGQPLILADRPVVTAAYTAGDPIKHEALATVLMPNPHVVVQVASEELDHLDLAGAPAVEPPLPTGQNVEFVTVLAADRTVRMRVHERGSGETRSCGTGICAVVVAVATAQGHGADGVPWRVEVPGGACTVVWDEHGVTLTGPAVIVAEVRIDPGWWQRIRSAQG